MQLTLTAKVKLTPTAEQRTLLLTTIQAIIQALNLTSRFSFQQQVFSPFALHNQLYRTLRTTFGLRSQMAQSVLKTVAAKYKAMKTNEVTETLAVFKKPEYDLVYNRDLFRITLKDFKLLLEEDGEITSDGIVLNSDGSLTQQFRKIQKGDLVPHPIDYFQLIIKTLEQIAKD